MLNVSKICFGSLTLGPLQANFDVDKAGEIIAYAFSKGINFIDTAQLYKTYPHINNALKRYGKDDIVISSKTYAYNKEQATKAVEEAKKALNRDVIDIFMLHEQESSHTLRGHREALDTLLEYKSKGIIKNVGISMHHIAAVYGAIDLGFIDVIHPLINVNGLGIVDGTREEMEKALIKAKEKGMFIFSMKSLGGGNLFQNAEKCLQYAFGLPFLDSVAIGMQSIEEIDANIQFLENLSFSEEHLKKLKEKKRSIHIDDWCNGCGKCAKVCPQKALSVIHNKAKCGTEKCILCGYCSAYCEMWAIKIV